jgi:hypothetical protein
VGAHSWVLLDEEGRELRAVESFGSQKEAEAWLTGVWESLAQEGAACVRLVACDEASGDEVVYEMKLSEG